MTLEITDEQGGTGVGYVWFKCGCVLIHNFKRNYDKTNTKDCKYNHTLEQLVEEYQK